MGSEIRFMTSHYIMNVSKQWLSNKAFRDTKRKKKTVLSETCFFVVLKISME